MSLSINLNSAFRTLAALIMLAVSTINVYSQNAKKVDSLQQLLAIAKSNTAKIEILKHITEITQDRKQLEEGFTQMAMLGKTVKDYPSICLALSQLGYYAYEKRDYTAAEMIFREGMELAKKTGNDFAFGRMCNTMMSISDKKGDMVTAINYLKEGEKLLIKTNKPVNLTRLYCNASELYKDHNMSEKALEYARKAYSTALSSGEKEPMTTASWYLANRLQIFGKYDSALHYYIQGLNIAESLELGYTQGDMLRGISSVYSDLRQYSPAKEFLKKAIIKYDSVHVKDRVTECEESLSYIDFMTGDFDKVKEYLHIRELMVTADSLENKRYINKWLANLALVDGRVEDWVKYYRQYEEADAALTNNKIQKNILELEAKYNLAKKESELLQKETENRKRLWIIGALAFGLLSLVAIALMQYGNYKNKNKITEQKTIIEKQNALSEERLRIAADMHDDVGAGLSRIRYITSSLQNPDGSSNEGMIEKIVSLSDESVEKMNEIIWALNQGNQQLAELIYYIRSQCSEMANQAGMAFTFELPENIPSITLGWKECRNIYLLVKEAVNNAIKHAGGTSITIECSIGNDLQISVADDGKGFDPDLVKKNGNGLLNYIKRIDNLKGTYQLITAPAKGTKLLFSIPLMNAR